MMNKKVYSLTEKEKSLVIPDNGGFNYQEIGSGLDRCELY